MLILRGTEKVYLEINSLDFKEALQSVDAQKTFRRVIADLLAKDRGCHRCPHCDRFTEIMLDVCAHCGEKFPLPPSAPLARYRGDGSRLMTKPDGWGTGGNNPPKGGSSIQPQSFAPGMIAPGAGSGLPGYQVVIHYCVLLPDGQQVVCADKASADRLSGFLQDVKQVTESPRTS